MAENIVGSLFGVNPEMYQQNRDRLAYNQDLQAVQLDPIQQANLAIRQGSRGLGRAAGGLLGLEDPELAKVSQIKQLSSQFDLTTSKGMREFARALQQIAPQEAMMAAKRADEMMATQEQTALRSAQTRQAEAGKVIQVDLGDRIQLVNALTNEIIREIPKGLTPAQAAKAAGGGEDGVGTPGPVGKAGAFRDINGQIYGASEMKVVRQEFEGAQKLLDTLNQVKESDVKDAQSYVDWTTKGETKALASKKTLMAQTKIAASQLMEQINQLPPGSASDADMRASMKSFPGYSDADALAAWVNETKRKLQSTINRGQDQFGLKSRVQPTAPLDLTKKQSTGKTTTSDDDLVNKYLKAKTQ